MSPHATTRDTGVHVALVSIFGIIFGIGVGLCMKPCLDKYTNGGKGGTVHTTGDRGLEAWSQSNNGCVCLCVLCVSVSVFVSVSVSVCVLCVRVKYMKRVVFV